MSLRIISGVFRGRMLKTPTSEKTRPTTSILRGAVFNICSEWVPKARVLDIFAGSGAIGFEAISRGASFVTFIEQDKAAAECIRENVELLKVQPQAQLLQMNAKTALPRLLSSYDLIYLDPPYGLDVLDLLQMIATQGLLAPSGLVFLEERYDPKGALKTYTLPGFELIESRRYGIAYLHQFRHSVLQ